MASKDIESFRESDSQFIFKALNYATTPIVINCTPLATEEDAKIGTIQKRISVMSKRWNLPISTTTTKGDANSNAPATPAKLKTTQAKAAGSTGGRKRKAPVKNTKVGSDDGEANDECEENATKKQKRPDSEAEQDGDAAADDAEGESASEDAA